MADSVVDLGAGSSGGLMSMNEALGLEMGDPGYAGQFPGRIYKEGDTMVDRDYYNDMGDYEFSADRVSPYEGLAESYMDMTDVEVLPMLEGGKFFPNSIYGKTGQNVPVRPQLEADGSVTVVPIGFQEGGLVEEVGIMGALFSSDVDLPSSADQELVRTSAREGTEGAAMYYPAGAPTFEEVLEQQYGYPDAEREIYGATTSEAMRAGRPRHDMPTYQELEDARAHVLQSALLSQQVGPETAETFGGMAELFDRYVPILGTATDADVVMDKRNNAFGAKLLKEAGINATPKEITQMVDQKIFDQLDIVLGREEGERRFKSPSTGIDIFYPRDKYGYFDVNRYD
jgi:hypothetical protein